MTILDNLHEAILNSVENGNIDQCKELLKVYTLHCIKLLMKCRELQNNAKN